MNTLPRKMGSLRLGVRTALTALALAGAAVFLLLMVPRLDAMFRAASFLGGLMSAQQAGGSSAARTARDPVSEDLRLDVVDRQLRARLYLPASGRGLGIVVAHGIHHRGIDEARLVRFAEQLAAAGVVVLTPELPDLADYRVTHSGVAVLTEAVKFLAGQRQHVTSERVALLGFSFGGGLSLLAAAEPGISSHLRLVASVGGYHDLERVLRFYVSGEADTPEGSLVLRPHEYGLVVLAYSHIDQLVPTEDVDVMRHALREWLQEDRDSARGWASQSTSEESERLFQLLEAQRLPELRAEFEALIDQDRERLHLLSPSGVLERVDVPVHLLHSASDTVIPPSETRWASVELAHHRHSTLVSPLLGHAALDRDADRSLTDSLELVWFMSQVL